MGRGPWYFWANTLVTPGRGIPGSVVGVARHPRAIFGVAPYSGMGSTWRARPSTREAHPKGDGPREAHVARSGGFATRGHLTRCGMRQASRRADLVAGFSPSPTSRPPVP